MLKALQEENKALKATVIKLAARIAELDKNGNVAKSNQPVYIN